MNEIMILSTVDSAELGRKIAGALVNEGLAACVNVIPGVRSVYRWQGKICDEEELLLLVKTTSGRFEEIRRRIRELHSYEVPEILALPIGAGDEDYIQWLHEQVGGGGGA